MRVCIYERMNIDLHSFCMHYIFVIYLKENKESLPYFFFHFPKRNGRIEVNVFPLQPYVVDYMSW